MRNDASQVGDTVEQLRHDIDTGRTGDKVCWPDPAAAPLGTDEEAAGTPLSPELVAHTREREVSRRAAPATTNARDLGAAWILISFVAILVAVMLIYLGRLISV